MQKNIDPSIPQIHFTLIHPWAITKRKSQEFRLRLTLRVIYKKKLAQPDMILEFEA